MDPVLRKATLICLLERNISKSHILHIFEQFSYKPANTANAVGVKDFEGLLQHLHPLRLLHLRLHPGQKLLRKSFFIQVKNPKLL